MCVVCGGGVGWGGKREGRGREGGEEGVRGSKQSHPVPTPPSVVNSRA